MIMLMINSAILFVIGCLGLMECAEYNHQFKYSLTFMVFIFLGLIGISLFLVQHCVG